MIYTQKTTAKHSVVDSADKLSTARTLTVSDGTHTTSTSFDGSGNATLSLPTHISVATVQGTAALIMPTASSGPANGIFIATS